MRLIDADELIKDDEVNLWLSNNAARTWKTLKMFSELFIKKIDEQPTINPFNWIKCSDRLPDLDVEVLGTRKEHGDVVMVARWESCFEECGWEWILTDDGEGNSYKPDEIIAWMPVPEGFKEEMNG